MASGHDSAADSSADVAQPSGDERPQEGPLAGAFRRIVESLPDDWTDLEFDLRIADESRYVEAAVFMVTCNAEPYSRHDCICRGPFATRSGQPPSAPPFPAPPPRLDEPGFEAGPPVP